MKKISIILPVLVVVAGCKQTASTSGADGGAVATADSAGTKTTASTVVDKALSFLGAGPFEGEITMNVSDAGKPLHTITYDVKGPKMRFDAPAEAGPMAGGYVIFDTTNKQMTSVNDAKKTAFVMNMNAMPGGPNAAAAQAAQKKPNIEKTGKTDTVAGYSCEIWKVTEDNGDKGEICIAKGIAFPAMRGQAGWMSSLEDGFPLRVVMNDSTGKEKSRMDVTKVEKKSLDDSKFQVPAGYQTMNMEDMMKGLGGLRNMGGAMGRPPR